MSEIADLVAGIIPFDDRERAHQAEALAWLARTKDIYRREKPGVPSPHLVAYAVLADLADWRVFLVDHVLAGLWLPTGGHVEPGEHPSATARREAREELGIEPVLADESPAFLTVTRTVDDEHTDVSLWYVLAGNPQMRLVLDPREFNGGRWWTAAEIEAADPRLFDPHMGRFLAKMRT
jgi:8-oxo-dGTP pyrophosphatase MutT (NUDIX family)